MKNLILISTVVTGLLAVGVSLPVFADSSEVKVTGEVIDTFCYMSMGAHGESHRQCGIGCAKKGIPVGIVENGTGNIYVLLPVKEDTALPDGVINKMGQTATISGHVYSKGGSRFLTVETVG